MMTSTTMFGIYNFDYRYYLADHTGTVMTVSETTSSDLPQKYLLRDPDRHLKGYLILYRQYKTRLREYFPARMPRLQRIRGQRCGAESMSRQALLPTLIGCGCEMPLCSFLLKVDTMAQADCYGTPIQGYTRICGCAGTAVLRYYARTYYSLSYSLGCGP